MAVPSADKVQIYAPSPMAQDSATMLLQLGSSGSRRPLLGVSEDSKQPDRTLSPLSRKLSHTSGLSGHDRRRSGGKARRRSSILSEIGAMVAPLEGNQVEEAAQRANEERAETLLQRMKRWALRPQDIFSLKLFGGGKGISQVYRRGHLPADAMCIILDPKSQGLKRWDMFIMLLLLYTAVVTPYEVGFSEPQLDFWFFLNRFIDLSFGIDLVVNFLTARFDDAEARWVYKPKDIAIIYLTSWFTIDFVSILPFDVMGLVMESDAVKQFRLLRVVRLLRLLKLARILRASRIFRRWENQINMSYSFMSLIKFMVGVSTVSHWMACTWRIIVDIEDANTNWMINYHDIDQDGGGKQYIAALYWSVMTITTIGYGDVVARSNGERMLATVCMLLGASIYAYVVGAVCGIVSGLDEATAKFHQTMDQLNVYMSEYHLPKELQVTLREYFRHCRTLARERHYHDLLVQMSPALRGQVAVFCHSAWILKVPFFNSPSVSDEEREQFIIEIAMAIEPEAYPPNEAIFRVNNPATQMYIVQKGVVAKQGHVLRGGSYFGEDMILKNYKRPYSVRTLTYVDCFRLNKDKLADIIRHDEFPATRIAIRRATIALAFRIKFLTIAKALEAFKPNPNVRRTPVAALPSRHRLSDAELVVLPPGNVNTAAVVAEPTPAASATASLRQDSARGASGHGSARGASADAGAGETKRVSPGRRNFATGGVPDTLSDEEDSLIRSRDLVSPHVIAGSGHSASYKQLRPAPNTGPSMKDVLAAVDRRHNQTMEALMIQFDKLTTRMDKMAERVDTIQSHGRSSCC